LASSGEARRVSFFVTERMRLFIHNFRLYLHFKPGMPL
jgi:hypothetical protein